ncbi:MAG: SPOR domain-containing protein [Ignavibacteria bacterium]|nr:SPOR domain-containing protein [Ignavibacteria bacterium]
MKRLSFLFLIGLIIGGCSSSQETQSDKNKNEPDYYIFDDVEKIDTLKNGIEKPSAFAKDSLKQEINPVVPKDSMAVTKYIVQLGAFSTKERADVFIKENQGKISFMMSAIYKKQSNLYVVQLPPFVDRAEAESVRNTLWKIAAFKDAFIVNE